MEKKPGGKNGSGKKAWWKESLVSFGKDGKKAWCLFLGLKHIKLNDEVKLTDYFNRLPFQAFDLKIFFGIRIYFSSTIYFYQTRIQKYVKFIMLFTPQPLRAVRVLFSPMVSGWAGGGKKFVQAVSRKP